MDEITRDAIVSIAAFAAIFGILYVYFMTRHRERMFMLEKNIPSSTFRSIHQSNILTLKYGLLATGVAIGIVMGAVVKNLGYDKSVSFLAMIFLFGGIALIISHFITRNYAQKNKL